MIPLTYLQTLNSSPFEWVAQHLQVIGWPTLCIFAWKVATYFERLSAQASKTIGQIDTLATNHFPHMEASLKNQDDLLHSMDKSLSTIADNSRRRREDF
jgi:hypothetical protein